jgi:tetratricopeptide (TPR) repeat protein
MDQGLSGAPRREEGRERSAGGANLGAVAASPLPVPQATAYPYTGRFKKVMNALKKKDLAGALTIAAAWREEDPGDVMALIALGEVLEAQGDDAQAARAYGSIIDLFAARADLRRFAGARLEHLKGNLGLELAVDTFSKAAAQRPDHPSSHRLLAFALLKKEEHAKAFDAIVKGLNQEYPEDRFAGVHQILVEDLGLIGAAWIKADPGRRKEILRRLEKEGSKLETDASLRFVLNWETDANDVDFHIYDGQGGHAFFQDPNLGTGGSLYADVTTGYGPECFTIRLPRRRRSYPYTLQAHYYSRGPMGYGMGKLEIIEHDGKGGLTFDERMFVVMVDEAFVDMGKVRR